MAKKTPTDKAATRTRTTRRAAHATADDPPEAVLAAAQFSDLSHSLDVDDVARAAYYRYLSRGGSDGQDFEDWIEAERALRERYR